MPRTFTVDELIVEHPELRLSRKLLYRLIHTGELCGYQLGGVTSAWLVDETEWNRFLNDRRTRGRAS